MDASPSVDDIIACANKMYGEGNYRGAVAALEPLLRKERRKTLSPAQELDVVYVSNNSYRFLDQPKAALPHMKRALELTIQVNGKGSKGHASALHGLGLLERELKDYPSAKMRFKEGLAILVALGEEKSPDYGNLLMGLADLELDQERWAAALEGYIKAKAVMENFKEHTNYAVMVSDMAGCYKKLNRWTECFGMLSGNR